MSRTSFGLRIYAVAETVLLEAAGVNPRRILIYVYSISGTLAEFRVIFRELSQVHQTWDQGMN